MSEEELVDMLTATLRGTSSWWPTRLGHEECRELASGLVPRLLHWAAEERRAGAEEARTAVIPPGVPE